ncbi:MAG: uroporphyrin-III C-methyltransferase/precorrin-2 dehydrogenase/sirohydrochlorin ferrochelatase [Patiriisocius sp.]|jgi:uroporphyrin-III C-methyltransferase/precorrin-2 dehydrogenase/sirohydrochlorin ferrochelatase
MTMHYFPVFLSIQHQRVLVSGAGDIAVAKLRLLLKTSACLEVYGADPSEQVVLWAEQGRLTLQSREITQQDFDGHGQSTSDQASGGNLVRLFYIANGDDVSDTRIADLARRNRVLFCVVDRLDLSQFITPAIVDRDPVVVAIGTEGTAPVLARKIKSLNESELAPNLGSLARVSEANREAALALPTGKDRRECWKMFFNKIGPEALAANGVEGAQAALQNLFSEHFTRSQEDARISIVGAGPGDPELLTLKARRLIADADVIVYDRLVAPSILELARREATFVDVGKAPGNIGWTQSEINSELVLRAQNGAHVVRLKSGDPSVYGRLDEELCALDDANIAYDIVPGITSALSAAAAAKVSLTKRHRNSSVRFITGQDIEGFAEHDWESLSQTGNVSVLYMGRSASRFVQARLLLHGTNSNIPITIVENASRPDQRILATKLSTLVHTIDAEELTGPLVMLIGLEPRVTTSSRALGDELSQLTKAIA